MSLLGTYLTLMVGPSVPKPASAALMESLDSIEVSHRDQGRSGFQITFRVGRSDTDALDYALLGDTKLHPYSRIVLLVTFNAVPRVLMDGIITNQQLAPSEQPGTSTLTVTGEDVSIMMDLEEKSVEHPAQDETVIANKIIASYAKYGFVPTVIAPPTLDVPLATERTPVQQGTDLQYLQEMAERYAYVFYVTAGPAPLVNTAYWGPPVRAGTPQSALSVNMGSSSNVDTIDFQYDGLAATVVTGQVQDRTTGDTVAVETVASTRVPLVSQPAWKTQAQTRTRLFRESGRTTTQAYARAQAEMDAATDTVITATGNLDTARYGALLQARGLVGLRGAGYSYDGSYYVKDVTHTISKSTHKQRFTLTREGLGALLPIVNP